MQKIFDEYGGVIIAIVVIAALILIISFTKGPLNGVMQNMISSFSNMSTNSVKSATDAVTNTSGGAAN